MMNAFDYTYTNETNTDINQRFQVQFKPVTKKVLSWKEELINVAKSINTNKPIYVCMSGGIDGEVVARVLMEQSIPFKVLTVKHIKGTNNNDTTYADLFCQQYNLEQISVPIDVEKFFTDGIENYIRQGYRSINIYHYFQLFILETVERLGGYALGGAGELVFHTVNNNIHIKMNPSYTLGMDWCRRNNKDHNLWFFHSSPELYASYLKSDLIDFLLNSPEFFVNHHYGSEEKKIVYHKHFPDMLRREKLSGFGNVSDMRKSAEKQLKKMFPDLQDLYIPVNLMKSQLGI